MDVAKVTVHHKVKGGLFQVDNETEAKQEAAAVEEPEEVETAEEDLSIDDEDLEEVELSEEEIEDFSEDDL